MQQNSWIQTSQTGSQPYSDTSPYEVSECSLAKLFVQYFAIYNNENWPNSIK